VHWSTRHECEQRLSGFGKERTIMGAVKEVFMERCQKWADEINDWYGLRTTDAEVAAQVWKEANAGAEYSFMWEIEQNSFSDTSPREAMADAIAKSRIGMEMPCYGHSEEYKQEFQKKMELWLDENDLSL
jgi:hypothetical protein